MSKAERAPLFTDAFALCEWLLGRFGEDTRELPRALCRRGFVLLQVISLALRQRDRDDCIDRADEELIGLRNELRLAAAVGYLSDAQTIHALERADAIGRQLGGWLRALGPM